MSGGVIDVDTAEGEYSQAVTDNPFDPSVWQPVDGFELTDITYHRHVVDGKPQPTVRVAFDRPEVRNAFRPHSVDELYRVLDHARMWPEVGVVLLTGNGPSPKDGGWAFCSGGDQRIRGRSGYQYAAGETAESVDPARAGRLHILEVQRLIRFMPKVVICLVNGWAAGGGHSLHVTCDLTLASREHARFKQTDADVGSFDGGYGSAYLAKQVGQKFAREIFFLGRPYTAEQMYAMGAVNEVVDHADLEKVGIEWAQAINGKSPQAIRMLKYAFNLTDDGLVGQQLFAGEATRLAYMTDEAVEGRDAFLEKRDPDWSQFPALLLRRFVHESRPERRLTVRRLGEGDDLRRLDPVHVCASAFGIEHLVVGVVIPVVAVFVAVGVGQVGQRIQSLDAFGAAFDNDIDTVVPGVGPGGDGDGVAVLEVAGLLLVGAGAEHEAVVDPHPDQWRDVRVGRRPAPW